MLCPRLCRNDFWQCAHSRQTTVRCLLVYILVPTVLLRPCDRQQHRCDSSNCAGVQTLRSEVHDHSLNLANSSIRLIILCDVLDADCHRSFKVCQPHSEHKTAAAFRCMLVSNSSPSLQAHVQKEALSFNLVEDSGHRIAAA